MAKRTVERRFTTAEVSVRMLGDTAVIEGHAAMFRKLSQNLGGFVEEVLPGAFTKTLREADVRALFNHDPNMPLGRNRANTLDLSEDDSGLYYRIKPPDTSYARDLMVSMERGDVNQSSFAFTAIEEDWGMTEQNFPVRSLVQVQLFDVSPVTYPAYLDTDSNVGRSSALAGLSLRSGIEIDELDADAITRLVNEMPTGHNAPTGETIAASDQWALRAQYAEWLEKELAR